MPASLCSAERQPERSALAKAVAEMGVRDPRVLAAIGRVPRHTYVSPQLSGSAYENRPLSIGRGQTISQPFIVAAMTEAACARSTGRCLEIGTGSGYQAAVLAEVFDQVYSIEYLPELGRLAEHNLRRSGLGEPQLRLRVGHGGLGWPEAAPFDAIVVTAAPETPPAPLLEQLGVGGRLIIPLGPAREPQHLECVERLREGSEELAFKRERLMSVRFVPFLGAALDGA